VKARLITTVHVDWLPDGTIGDYFLDRDGLRRFKPDNPIEGYGFRKDGAYIGGAKIKKIKARKRLTGGPQ
jgi:hypothetical protein